VLDKSMIERDK